MKVRLAVQKTKGDLNGSAKSLLQLQAKIKAGREPFLSEDKLR